MRGNATSVWFPSLLIIFVLAVGLAGCTAAAPPQESAAPTTAPSGESTTPGELAEIYFDPAVTVELVRTQPGTTVYFPEGDTPEDNRWTRAIAEEYGINVTYKWIVDPSQFDQRINLMLASGDLPDVFAVNPTQFLQLVEAGQVQDLTDVYATYAPEAVRQVMEEDALPMQSATIDGRLMGIPFTFLARENVPMLWVRTDWLESLGLSAPTSMQDILAISEAFTTQDPDGNGADDTFGLAIDQDLGTLTGFFNGYHAYPGIWIEDEAGNLISGTIQPEVKEALAALQEMYASGQIDPEFGVKNFATVAEDIISSKIGLYYGVFSNGVWPLQPNVNNDPTAEWQAYTIVSIDDQPALVQVPLSVHPSMSYWVVRTGYEHPEAVLAMMNFFLETFYFNTDQDIFYEFVDGPGENEAGIWQNAPVQAYRSFKNRDLWSHITVEQLPDDQLTPEERKVLDQINQYLEGERGFWGWNKIYGENGSMSVIDTYDKEGLYQEDKFITAPTGTMTRRLQTLVDRQVEVFTNIIQGGSLDEFDAFVEEWQSQGGAQITQEVNEWYDAQ